MYHYIGSCTGSSPEVKKNDARKGLYSFVDFKASAVCFTNPLKTGRDLVLFRIVASLLGVFKNSRRLGMGESYIPVLFFDPLLHGSPCFPYVDFVALAGNPVNNAIFLAT